MKFTSPAYFVCDEQFIMRNCIPPIPEEKKEWEKYLQQIYDATLTSLLDIQRSQFESEHSKLLTPFNYQVVEYYFQKLKHILNTPVFSREEASKQLKPCTKTTIAVLRSSFKNV